MNTLVLWEQKGGKNIFSQTHTSGLALVLEAEPKCACQECERILLESTGKSFPYWSSYCSPADKFV